jgi:gamma-polyglutamate biosynthesis protein CapA
MQYLIPSKIFVLVLFSSFLICAVLFLSHTSSYQQSSTVVDDLATTARVAEKEPPERLLFLGDVMLGRHVEVLAKRHGISYLTAAMVPITASNITIVANFESAMATPHKPTESGEMRFSTDRSLLPVLRELGVTHASLANNHALDYSVSGYENTKAELSALGIVPFGHPTVLSSSSISYQVVAGTKVAVIGIHTLFVEPSTSALTTVVKEASANSDLQIAYVHWGNEYELVHSSSQKAVAQVLVDAGIDVIIGHHPHVTQDIGLIEGIPVFYSLGNFIFDQYFSKDVKEGYSVQLEVTSDALQFTLIPHRQEVKSQITPLTGVEKAVFLEALAARSDLTIATEIMAGTITILR